MKTLAQKNSVGETLIRQRCAWFHDLRIGGVKNYGANHLTLRSQAGGYWFTTLPSLYWNKFCSICLSIVFETA